ncbi:crystallin beta/gamma motif-containing protein [Caudoviricetes sp.]|nr:crystallin beta/gamma motif-containing protein [Caudoviricetes sp.]
MDDLEQQAQDQAFSTEDTTAQAIDQQVAPIDQLQPVTPIVSPTQGVSLRERYSSALNTPTVNKTLAQIGVSSTPEKDQLKEQLLEDNIRGLLKARGLSPVDGIRAKEIGEFLDVPQGVVMADLKGYERQYAQKKDYLTIKNNEVLISFLDEDNAKYLHDDLEKAGMFTQATTALSNAVSGSVTAQGENMGAFADLVAGRPPAETKVAPYDPEGFLNNALYYGTSLATDIGGSVARSTAGAGVGALAGSVIPGAGTLAGAGVGFTLGMATDGTMQVAGALYREMYYKQIKEGVSPEEALDVAYKTTVASLPANFALNYVPASRAVNRLVAPVATRVGQSAVARTAVDVGKGAIEGGGIAGLTSTINMALAEKGYQTSGIQNAYDNPSAVLPDLATRIAEEVTVGSIGFGALSGIMGTAGRMIKRTAVEAPEAINNEQMLSDAMDSASQTQTLGRDKETFNQLSFHALAESGADTVYMSQEKALEAYQADPELWKAIIPDIEAQIRTDAETGARISLSTANFITYMSDHPQGKSFLGDLSFKPDGLSANEARNYEAVISPQEREKLSGYIDSLTRGTSEAELIARKKVYNDVLSKLDGLDYGDKTDQRAYASLIAQRYVGRAKQNLGLNGDIWAEYQRDPFDIQVVKDGVNANEIAGAYFASKTKAGQSFDQTVNGRIIFDETRSLVQLFKADNPTTLIHEMGHKWLEEFKKDALTVYPEGSPERTSLLEDYSTTKQWFKESANDLLALEEKNLSAISDLTQRAERQELLKTIKENNILDKLVDNDLKALTKEEGEALTIFHESFARSFEQYVMEGKAPVKGLRRVFSRFAQYLKNIYYQIANLDAPVNDKIRGVFDRMLGADEAITQAIDDMGVNPLFQSVADSGMTEAQHRTYTEQVNESLEKTRTRLLKRTMKGIVSARKAEGQQRIYRNAQKAFSDVMSTTAVKAYYDIIGLDRDTGASKPNMKLDYVSTVALIGKEMADAMPKEVFGTDGLNLASVADALKYAEWETLASDLMAVGDLRKQLGKRSENMSIKDTVKELAIKQSEAEFVGQLDKDAIYNEAVELLHKDDFSNVLSRELDGLAKLAGEQSIDLSALQNWASDTFGAVETVKALKDSKKYLNASKEASNRAREAFTAKDYKEAFRSKKEQLASHLMYKEALKFRADHALASNLFKKIAKSKVLKDVSADHMAILHMVLQDQGMKTARSLQKAKVGKFEAETSRYFSPVDEALSLTDAYQKFVDADKLGIRQGVFFSDMLKQAEAGNRKAITTDQFQELYRTISSIHENGKAENTAVISGKKIALNDLIVSLIDYKGRKQKPVEAWASEQTKPLPKYLRDKIKNGVDSVHASMAVMDTIVNKLDRDDPLGAWGKLYNTIQHGKGENLRFHRELVTNTEAKLKKEMGRAGYKQWRKSLRGDVVNLTLRDHETGQLLPMNRLDIISMALNMGNEDNFTKLVEGRKRDQNGNPTGWTRENVNAIVMNTLTANDWKYINRLWEVAETLWPKTKELSIRLHGFAPPKVMARKVETPHGSFDGGYWPLVYTKKLEEIVGERTVGQSDLASPSMTSGAMKERNTAVRRPVALDHLSVISGISRHSYFLNMVEPVTTFNKVLSSRRVNRMLNDTIGEEGYKKMVDYIQDVASPARRSMFESSFVSAVASPLQAGMMMDGLGFSGRVIADSLSELFLSGINDKVGGINYGKAIARYLANPRKEMEWASQFSDVLMADGDTKALLRDFKREVGNRYGWVGDVYKDITNTAFVIGHIIDKLTRVWVARASYEKLLRENPLATDAEIAMVVNKATRETHVSSDAIDKSLIQRDKRNPALVLFMGFANKLYNRLSNEFRKTKDALTLPDIPLQKRVGMSMGSAMNIMLLASVAQISYKYTRGMYSDDEKEKEMSPLQIGADALIGGTLTNIPLARDAYEILTSDSPLAGASLDSRFRFFKNSLQDVRKMYKTGALPERTSEDMVGLIGTTFSLPASRTVNFGKWLYGINSGDIQYDEDDGLPQVLSDIQYGKRK